MVHPLLLAAGAFVAYKVISGRSAGGIDYSRNPEPLGEGSTPCERLDGIYHVPVDGKLPLTIAAAAKAEEFCGYLLSQDPFAAKGDVVLGALIDLTRGFSPPCDWTPGGSVQEAKLPSEDPMSGLMSKQERVRQAVGKIFDIVQCRNLFGVWAEKGSSGAEVTGTFPVTDVFYNAAIEFGKEYMASHNLVSKEELAEATIVALFPTSCQFHKLSEGNRTQQQKDVYSFLLELKGLV